MAHWLACSRITLKNCQVANKLLLYFSVLLDTMSVYSLVNSTILKNRSYGKTSLIVTVVKTPCFQCTGHRFNLCLREILGWGTKIPHAMQPKKKKKQVSLGKEKKVIIARTAYYTNVFILLITFFTL